MFLFGTLEPLRFDVISIAASLVSNCPISFSEGAVATVWRGTLCISDTITATKRATRELSGSHVYASAFSSAGQYLLLSIDQTLHLYRGTDASELSVLPTDQHHTSLIFTRDDGQVITRSEKGQVHFFSLSSDTLREIPGRSISTQAGILELVLCHDGQRLATSGMDGTIRIYHLSSLACVATLQRPGSVSAINAMAYHPKEEELAVGQDQCLVLWRKETAGDWVASIHGHHTSPIIGVAYCENGTRIYTGSQDGNVKLWENTRTQVQLSPKHTDAITCYSVDPRASLLATGSRDMSIILWNLTTGDYLRPLLSHKNEILSLEFSEDGALLASGSGDHRAIVWDVASGNVLHVLGPHDQCDRVLAFSEDHRHLRTATSKEIWVWELESGEVVEFEERKTWVNEAPKRPYRALTVNGPEWRRVAGSVVPSRRMVPLVPLVPVVPSVVPSVIPPMGLSSVLVQVSRRWAASAQASQRAVVQVSQRAVVSAQAPQRAVVQVSQRAVVSAQAPQRVVAQASVVPPVALVRNVYEEWAAEYLPCQIPPGYRVETSLILQDRAVFLCKDGRVLMVDTSRIEVKSASESE